MIWHVLDVVSAALWVVVLAALVVLYRKAGGEQLARDMRTAKRVTEAAKQQAATPRGRPAPRAR